jgi:hypothetical protein
MRSTTIIFIGLAIQFLSFVSFSQSSQSSTTKNIGKEFQTPPQAARPRVWWHWMNGNITKDGIRKDLLWMHRSGIGGFHNFDAAFLTPQIVPRRLVYMTPEWKEAFNYTTRLADSLKLEMGIAGSPGWSVTGGPWVPAKNGMKKLVWREVRVQSRDSRKIFVPKPYTTTGPFQNVQVTRDGLSQTAPPPEYYEDIAVIAYPIPATDILLEAVNPTITSSAGRFTLWQLTDGDLVTSNPLPIDTITGYAWIQYEFVRAQTIRAVSLTGGGIRSPFGIEKPVENRTLEVSDDGVSFRSVCTIPIGGVAQQTISFHPVTGKFIRLKINNPAAANNPFMAALGIESKPATSTDIAEFVLHPAGRINHAEEKAGFAATYDLDNYPTHQLTEGIRSQDVIDLTEKLRDDGTLEWAPPSGQGVATDWKIIRFGYSLTGKLNHPASPEATGLEVDKMDAQAVKHYFETYLNQYKDATGDLMGSRGLGYMVIDSYEAGQETWTAKMAEEFQQRRGYPLWPWMPVLTGQIVQSSDESERFLWDWRKTISELIVENHYDQLTDILARYGMKRYSESQENGRLYIVDGMDVKRKAAVPMSAIWAYTGFGSTFEMAQADIRESASVAHIYGQNLVAAEALTALGLGGNAWAFSPERLKPTADLAMASGLNRFVIHTSIHQPVDDKIPGLALGPFGQFFNRHETWAEQAKVWIDYLARSSYLLQQGKFVADVLYFYGEDNNITGLFGEKLPEIPDGYNYDFINPDALINLLSVKDGKLVTPGGMSYSVLVVGDNAKKMSLPVLRKLVELVKGGAIITGVKPQMSPSLSDDQLEFARLVNEVWNSTRSNVHSGETIQQVLSTMEIQPDFDYPKSASNAELLYVHRTIEEGDIYWVNNRSDRAETVKASFRVTGRAPEIWHAEDGRIEKASYTIANGRTTVSLTLTPNDAVFVLFRIPTTKLSVNIPLVREQEIKFTNGPWSVMFEPNRGAPAQASFPELTSYTENADSGIKYFSGTATYTNTFQIKSSLINEGSKLWIDLGDVKNLAEVIVNGKSLGVVWKKPFRVEASKALRAGANAIEIRVTNLWVNRLIGDAQPNIASKITYTTMPFYKATDPLLPSGLLGPIKILARH